MKKRQRVGNELKKKNTPGACYSFRDPISVAASHKGGPEMKWTQ